MVFLSHTSDSRARILAIVFSSFSLLLTLALLGTWFFLSTLTLSLPLPEDPKITQSELTKSAPVSPLLVQYQLDLPGRGEVFPALSASGVKDYWPLAILSISNTSKQPALQLISAEVPGWSQRLEQTIVLGSQETRSVHISPPLLPRAYAAEDIQAATLEIRVNEPHSGTVFAQSRPVMIHSGSDLYWGKQFANAQFVARWITPHDSSVLQLVSNARRFVPKGRLPGYNSNGRAGSLNAQVRTQAKAVFEAMKATKLGYVSSIFTFGDYSDLAQRIRLPRETLGLSTANCIDVSVAFASAMENLGMNPVIVIVPGHAFTGVRLGPQSSEILYLDLTVLPNGTFQQAIARAQSWLRDTPAAQVLTVDVASARRMGIYPLPVNAWRAGEGGVDENAPTGSHASITASQR